MITLNKLAERLHSMKVDIRQDALPNEGEEKDQWIEDLTAAEEILLSLSEDLDEAFQKHRGD